MDNEIYATPKANLERSEVTKDDIETYVQFGPYVEKFKNRLSCGTVGLEFNIYAALFGFFWAFFRKLNAAGIVVFTLETISGVISLILIKKLNLSTAIFGYDYFLAASTPGLLFVRLPFSLISNRLYYNSAISRISSIKSTLNIDESEMKSRISRAGGVRTPILVICVAYYLMLFFIK